MKKYIIKSTSRGKLNLYADPEFAAVLWKEVEDDDDEHESDDVVSIDVRVGDKFIVEWMGFELVDDDVVNLLRITQVFGEHNIQSTSLTYEAWVPTALLDLNSTLSHGFQISRWDDN